MHSSSSDVWHGTVWWGAAVTDGTELDGTLLDQRTLDPTVERMGLKSDPFQPIWFCSSVHVI
jgi:hypothetical protein